MSIVTMMIDKYKRMKNPEKYWREKGVTIGRRCEIYPSVSFGSEPYLISIGNHVRINEGVRFITHDGGVWVLREYLNEENSNKIDLFGKITVGDNVHIGTNATIMPGVSVGNNCIIGCGAIVTKDVANNTIVVGVPARAIETIDEYVKKHGGDFDYVKGLSREEKRRYLEKKYSIK